MIRPVPLLLLLAGCATAPAPAPPPADQPPAESPRPARRSALVFNVRPAEAEVLLDGRSLGPVAQLPSGGLVKVKPGQHRVALQCQGYVTWRAEVAVGEEREVIDVALERSR